MQDSSSDGPRKSRNRSSGSPDEGRPRSRNRRRSGKGPQSDQADGTPSRPSSAKGRSTSKSAPSGASSSQPRSKTAPQSAPKETLLQAVVRLVTFGRVKPASKKATAQSAEKASQAKSEKKDRREGARLQIEPNSPRLYVGNLAYSVKSEDLEILFSSYGNVVEATVITRTGTDQSKGFGFVEMSTLAEARAAVAALYDHEFRERKLLVTGAKEDGRSESESTPASREPRSSRPPREASSREPRERRGRREQGEGEGRERGGQRERRSSRSRSGRSEGGDKDSRKVHPRPIPVVGTPNLELSNLNVHAEDVEISFLFEGIGTITSRAESGSGEGGHTRNYRIEMGSVEEAQRAVTLLDGKHFMGYRITVKGESVE